MALSGAGPGQPPALVDGLPCKEAGDALKYAVLGLFCFGIFLEPYAIKKGLDAKKMIAANPGMTGGGKATAAIVLGSIILGLWVLGILTKLAGSGR
jgi:hypothetical protein